MYSKARDSVKVWNLKKKKEVSAEELEKKRLEEEAAKKLAEEEEKKWIEEEEKAKKKPAEKGKAKKEEVPVPEPPKELTDEQKLTQINI